MSQTNIKDNPVIKDALESLKHFENFERLIREAGMELRKSRSIQRKHIKQPHEETTEDKLTWEIYEKLSEIQHNIEWIKQGDEEID